MQCQETFTLCWWKSLGLLKKCSPCIKLAKCTLSYVFFNFLLSLSNTINERDCLMTVVDVKWVKIGFHMSFADFSRSVLSFLGFSELWVSLTWPWTWHERYFCNWHRSQPTFPKLLHRRNWIGMLLTTTANWTPITLGVLEMKSNTWVSFVLWSDLVWPFFSSARNKSS